MCCLHRQSSPNHVLQTNTQTVISKLPTASRVSKKRSMLIDMLRVRTWIDQQHHSTSMAVTVLAECSCSRLVKTPCCRATPSESVQSLRVFTVCLSTAAVPARSAAVLSGCRRLLCETVRTGTEATRATCLCRFLFASVLPVSVHA